MGDPIATAEDFLEVPKDLAEAMTKAQNGPLSEDDVRVLLYNLRRDATIIAMLRANLRTAGTAHTNVVKLLTDVLDVMEREWPQHKLWRLHSPEAGPFRAARAYLAAYTGGPGKPS